MTALAIASFNTKALLNGTTITMGETAGPLTPVYLNSTTYFKATNVAAGTLSQRTVAGLLLNGTASGDQGTLITSSSIIENTGTTWALTLGTKLYLGPAGTIVPFADLAQNDWIVEIASPLETDIIKVLINNLETLVP